MSHFYLTVYETVENAYYPRGTYGLSPWHSIDMRRDESCLLSVPYRDDSLFGGTYLGDEPDRLAEQVFDLVRDRLQPSEDRWVVHLGDLVIEVPIVSGGAATAYLETFNTANSSTLGPNLTWTETLNDLVVNTNELRCNAINVESAARAEHDLGSTDHSAQITVANRVSAGGNRIGVIVRYASGSDSGYRVQWGTSGSASNQSISVINSGTATVLSTVTDAAATGDVLMGVAQGSTLRSYRNGSLVTSVTDTTHTSNLRTGVYLRSTTSTANCTGDNFRAADWVTEAGSGGRVLVGM